MNTRVSILMLLIGADHLSIANLRVSAAEQEPSHSDSVFLRR